MLHRTHTFPTKLRDREPPAQAPRLERPGSVARIGDEVVACPKTEPHRNRALLDLARGKHCLFRIHGVCVGGTETTVAAHSNKAAHGKAGARKADDEYSVWACFGCHSWLDTGKATQNFKDTMFMVRHVDQVIEWRRIAASPSEPARDRLAAQWALDQLNATPVGEIA